MANPIKIDINKIKIDRIFCNKKTGQYSIVIPKKKLNGIIPKSVEIVWK